MEFLDELVAKKAAEKSSLEDADWNFHADRLSQMELEMENAFEASTLPTERDSAAVNDLLISLRLG